MGIADRPLYTLHFWAERVDSSYSPRDGFRAVVALPLATLDHPDRSAFTVNVHVPTEQMRTLGNPVDSEELARDLDAICSAQADRKVRAVLAGEEVPPLPAAGLKPKVPHGERARAFADTLKAKRVELEAQHGDEWLRVMLESEFRAVYSDGERKGYRVGDAIQRKNADIGEWYLTTLAPRCEGLPTPGAPLTAERFTVTPSEE